MKRSKNKISRNSKNILKRILGIIILIGTYTGIGILLQKSEQNNWQQESWYNEGMLGVIILSIGLIFLGFYFFYSSYKKIHTNPYLKKLKNTPLPKGNEASILQKITLLSDLGKTEDAYLLALKALELTPQSQALRSEEVWLISKLPELSFEAKVEIANKYSEDFPESMYISNVTLGVLYLEKNLAMSQSYLKKALEDNPFDSRLLGLLSVVERSLGNKKKAKKLSEQALEIDPEEMNALDTKDQLSNNFDQAVIRSVENATKEGSSLQSRIVAAENLAQKGKSKDAIKLLLSEIKEEPQEDLIEKYLFLKAITTPVYKLLYYFNLWLFWGTRTWYQKAVLIIFWGILILWVKSLWLAIVVYILNYGLIGVLKKFYARQLKNS